MKRSVLAGGIAVTLLLFVWAFWVDFSAAAQSGRRSQPAPTPTPRTLPEQDRPSANQPAQTPESPDDSGTIKIDTSLVSIPLTALDRTGRYVPFLKKEDFRVYEDGVEQEIADFTPVTVPLHVVLLLDTSRSTVFRLEDIQAAAVAFVEQLRSDDQVMVVSFDEKVYIDSEFTSDRARLRRAIYRTRTGGGTRLYEAVDLVISERLAKVDGRKAIVLFTDGVDTMSRGVTARQTIEAVEESEVLVYPIQYNTEDQMNGTYGGGNRNPNGLPPIGWPAPGRRRWPLTPLTPQFPGQWPPRGQRGIDYTRASEYLQQLADRSGGRLHRAETLGNVQQAFANIAEELRHQYALSYYPTNTKEDGTFRRIRIQAKTPGVIIRAREGYRAKGTPTGDEKRERPILRPRQLAETGQ